MYIPRLDTSVDIDTPHPPPTVNSFFSSLSSMRTTLNLTRGCKERYKRLTD